MKSVIVSIPARKLYSNVKCVVLCCVEGPAFHLTSVVQCPSAGNTRMSSTVLCVECTCTCTVYAHNTTLERSDSEYECSVEKHFISPVVGWVLQQGAIETGTKQSRAEQRKLDRVRRGLQSPLRFHPIQMSTSSKRKREQKSRLALSLHRAQAYDYLCMCCTTSVACTVFIEAEAGRDGDLSCPNVGRFGRARRNNVFCSE